MNTTSSQTQGVTEALRKVGSEDYIFRKTSFPRNLKVNFKYNNIQKPLRQRLNFKREHYKSLIPFPISDTNFSKFMISSICLVIKYILFHVMKPPEYIYTAMTFLSILPNMPPIRGR